MTDHDDLQDQEAPTDQILPVEQPGESPQDYGEWDDALDGAPGVVRNDTGAAAAEAYGSADDHPEDYGQWDDEAEAGTPGAPVAAAAPAQDGSAEGEWGDQAVYGPSTVIAVLDQIEALTAEARAVPLSANVIMNKAELLDLVDQAREALPDDLVAANAVVEDADNVLGRADSAAEVTVAEANARARATVEEAREKVDQMLAAAREQAERIVRKADEEAEATLAQAQSDAEATLTDADRHAEELISQERVTSEANSRAREIIKQAEATDAKLRGGADDYAASTLEEINSVLTELSRRADAGLRAIAQRQGRDKTDIPMTDED